jgi:hypothetical protein
MARLARDTLHGWKRSESLDRLVTIKEEHIGRYPLENNLVVKAVLRNTLN